MRLFATIAAVFLLSGNAMAQDLIKPVSVSPQERVRVYKAVETEIRSIYRDGRLRGMAHPDRFFEPSLATLFAKAESEARRMQDKGFSDSLWTCADGEPPKLNIKPYFGDTLVTVDAVVAVKCDGSSGVTSLNLVNVNGQWRIRDYIQPQVNLRTLLTNYIASVRGKRPSTS